MTSWSSSVQTKAQFFLISSCFIISLSGCLTPSASFLHSSHCLIISGQLSRSNLSQIMLVVSSDGFALCAFHQSLFRSSQASVVRSAQRSDQSSLVGLYCLRAVWTTPLSPLRLISCPALPISSSVLCWLGSSTKIIARIVHSNGLFSYLVSVSLTTCVWHSTLFHFLLYIRSNLVFILGGMSAIVFGCRPVASSISGASSCPTFSLLFFSLSILPSSPIN